MQRFALRTAFAAKSRVPLLRRGYAEAVPTDKIRLSLSVPHQAIFANKDVSVYFTRDRMRAVS